MAASKMSSMVTDGHRNMFRLMVAFDREGLFLMKEIFVNGTKLRDQSKTLEEFIILKNHMTMGDFRRKFNATSRDRIINDSSMESFDVGTWYLIIQYGCDGIAPLSDQAWVTPGTLENHLKCIVDFRNSFMYTQLTITDTEFFSKLEEMKQLFIETALLTKSRYSLDDSIADRIINHLQSGINKVICGPLEDIDFTSYEAASQFSSHKALLKETGIPELKAFIKKYYKVDPAGLILIASFPVEAEKIYFPPRIVEVEVKSQEQSCKASGQYEETTHDVCLEDIKSEETTHNVFLEDILKIAHMKGTDVIILEGTAGVGKTTIVKKLLSDWAIEKDVKWLREYDFVIPIECRYSYNMSLSQRVRFLLNKSTRTFFTYEEYMMACLLDLRTLFILEGVDEINSNSEKIASEILKIKRKNVTVLCTVRPDKVDELYQIISDPSRILHFRVEGLLKKDIKGFVEKYHKAFQDLQVTTQDNVNGLLFYLQTTGALLDDQWCLPLNLTVVTLFWCVDEIYSISCSIDLMIFINKLRLCRLKHRLANVWNNNLTEDNRTDKFESLLSEVALVGIRDSNIIIPRSEMEKLEEKCSELGISSIRRELLGGYLVQRNSEPPSALASEFIFPYKSIQHFYAAQHIYNQVFCEPNRDGKNAKRPTVTEVLSKINKESKETPTLSVYQDTLIILLGVLHHKKSKITQDSARELVRLLKETGIKECEQWMKILSMVKCTSMVSNVLITVVPDLLRKINCITDVNVFASSTIMQYAEGKKVDVCIKGKPSQIICLYELCCNLAKGKVAIKNLCLEHLFRFPGTETYFMESVLSILKKCKVKGNYLGQFPHDGDLLMEKSEKRGRELSVSLANSEDADYLFSHLQRRIELERPLLRLILNVGSLPASVLKRIPDGVVKKNELVVLVPDVEDEQRAVDILQTLNPEGDNGFSAVCFPRFRTKVSLGDCHSEAIRSLLDSLNMLKVRMCFVFPSKCRPSDNVVEKELQETCKRILQCSHGISWGSYEGQKGEILDMDTWH